MNTGHSTINLMLLVQEFTSTSYFWGQQNTSTYGLTLHRKIPLFNLNSKIIRQTSLNCFRGSTGQMYEKCLPLSTPSPTQPEQDITSVAPTTNNYQNSFQDVTFIFPSCPKLLNCDPFDELVSTLGNLSSRQMLQWLSWNMAILIHIHNRQVQLPPRSDNKWMGLSLQSDGHRLVHLGVWFPVHLLQRPHMGQFSVYRMGNIGSLYNVHCVGWHTQSKKSHLTCNSLMYCNI